MKQGVLLNREQLTFDPMRDSTLSPSPSVNGSH
jgi:hypothetical protein